MKLKSFIAAFLFLIVYQACVFAQTKATAPTVDDSGQKMSLFLDYNLRLSGDIYSNIDYTSQKTVPANVLRQYMSIAVTGKFDERIEMSAKLAYYGVAGSNNSIFLTNYSRYNPSLFLQTAFLTYKGDPKAEIPFTLLAGKQEITYGSGLIIDSNANGMLALRGQADFFNSFSLDVFAGKLDNIDFTLFGGNIKLKMLPIIEFGIYGEQNRSGFAFNRGIYDPAPEFAIATDKKIFYNFRLSGEDKSYRYSIEIARQTGELVKSSTESFTYGMTAFLAEGWWQGKMFSAKSNAGLIFSYNGTKEGYAFNPTFTKRYTEDGRTGYGFLFAASAADSFLILPAGFNGINTLGIKFDTEPLAFTQAGAGFFFYSASGAPSGGAAPGLAQVYGAAADLGSELDLFVKYRYRKYFSAGINFGMYMPPKTASVFANTQNAYLLQLKVNAKF